MRAETMFDKVFESLLDATRKNASHGGELTEARHQAHVAADAVVTLKQQVVTLESDLKAFRGTDDTFISLYDSIESAAQHLRLGDGKSQSYAVELLARMKAAKKFIDPIPF